MAFRHPHPLLSVLLMFMTGITGLGAGVLPFAFDISPVQFVFQGTAQVFRSEFNFLFLFLFPFGISLTIPLLVAYFYTRWLLAGPFTRTENAIGLLIGTLSLLTTFVVITPLIAFSFWAPVALPPEGARLIEAVDLPGRWLNPVLAVFLMATPLLGLCAIVRAWRSRTARETLALTALQTAYLPSSFVVLSQTHGSWQVGGYLAMATASGYMAWLTLAIVHPQGPLSTDAAA
jgi:hypothetical protein